jgi:hypothetical protein
LKRFLKFFLPHGLVELVRSHRKLHNVGRRFSPGDIFRPNRLALEADTCGLTLFPPGYTGKLRNIVDVGANTGQWSGMLFDCITPEKLIIIEPLSDAFAALREKFGTDRRVELHNVAIGERESVETLRESGFGSRMGEAGFCLTCNRVKR